MTPKPDTPVFTKQTVIRTGPELPDPDLDCMVYGDTGPSLFAMFIAALAVIGVVVFLVGMVSAPWGNSRVHYNIRDYTPIRSVSVDSSGTACGAWAKGGINAFGSGDYVTICFSVKTGRVLKGYLYSW